MTHKERMQKMAEYSRDERRGIVFMALFLGFFAALLVYLNIDAVLWILGK